MTPSVFLPEWQAVPIGGGLYRPAYRMFSDRPLRLVPGSFPETCPIKAASAAKAYVARRLNPPIRASQASVSTDPLGISDWRKDRAGKAAIAEQQAFGTIFRKGKAIPVEKRRRFA